MVLQVPKNYAFFYAVKDKASGDDFSHTQAHNGRATQGEYRVRLPDGRLQVVSYTADKSGYRADVRYDEDKRASPFGDGANKDDDGGNSVYPTPDDAGDDYNAGPQTNYITANIFPVDAHHNLAHSYASTTLKVTPTVSTFDIINYTPQAYAYNTLITGRTKHQRTRPVYYTNSRAEFDSAGYINHVATDIHSPTLPPVPPVQSTVATPIVEETDEGDAYGSVGPTVTPYPEYYSLPSSTPVAYVFVPRQQQQYTYGAKLY